jgi:hypothetical protein
MEEFQTGVNCYRYGQVKMHTKFYAEILKISDLGNLSIHEKMYLRRVRGCRPDLFYLRTDPMNGFCVPVMDLTRYIVIPPERHPAFQVGHCM